MLEQASARQLEQACDGGMEARALHLLGGGLAALGVEGEVTMPLSASLTLDLSRVVAPRVPCSRAYSSLPARIAVSQTSSITQAAAKRRSSFVGGEPSADRAPDRRQRLGEAGKAPRLQHLAHLGPFGMVAILQPAGCVLAHRLQVRRFIGREAHVDIGRRHGERFEALISPASRKTAPVLVTNANPLPQRWRRNVSASGLTMTRPFSSASRATTERCDMAGQRLGPVAVPPGCNRATPPR